MESAYGLVMPRRMQVEFSAEVQQVMDDTGQEQSAQDIWAIFERAYLEADLPVVLLAHRLEESRDHHAVELDVMIAGKPRRLRGEGNGPLDAALRALGLPLSIHSFEERSLGIGGDARAVAFLEIASPDMAGTLFGAGCSSSIVEASLRALISAANRLIARDEKLQEAFSTSLDAA